MAEAEDVLIAVMAEYSPFGWIHSTHTVSSGDGQSRHPPAAAGKALLSNLCSTSRMCDVFTLCRDAGMQRGAGSPMRERAWSRAGTLVAVDL